MAGMGSGGGSVGRAVTTNTRGSGFKSSHRKALPILPIYYQLYWKDEKKKRLGMAHLKKQWLGKKVRARWLGIASNSFTELTDHTFRAIVGKRSQNDLYVHHLDESHLVVNVVFEVVQVGTDDVEAARAPIYTTDEPALRAVSVRSR